MLGIYPFRDLFAGAKFETIKIFRAKTPRIRQKPAKFVQKRHEVCTNLPRPDNLLANRHEATSPIRISDNVNLPRPDNSLANRHEATSPIRISDNMNLPKSDNSLANRHEATSPI